MKDVVRKRYDEHIDYLKQFDDVDSVINDYKNVLNFLDNDRTDEIEMFKFKTNRIDRLRDENVFNVFPELEDLR